MASGMNTYQDFLSLSLLLAYGKIPVDGVERFRHCQNLTKLSLHDILLACRLLSEREVEMLEAASLAVQSGWVSFLKGLMLFRQTENCWTSVSELVASPLFNRLNALCIHLLQMGVVGLDDLQDCLEGLRNTSGELDGYYLWTRNLISLEQWKQAVTELRLIQIGLSSVIEIENVEEPSASASDMDAIFDSKTWLFPSEAFGTPNLLRYLENAICCCVKPYEPGARLNIPMSIDMQRLIVALKDAVEAQQLNSLQAKRMAGIAYAAPDLALSLRQSLESLKHECRQTATLENVPVISMPQARARMDVA
jgi:hypothetical protein